MSGLMAASGWGRGSGEANGCAKSDHPETQIDAREQLLVNASRLMRENDTIHVSLSELSKAANLNSALVKYYFGNKGGLMREVLMRDMEGIKKAFEDLAESD